MQTFPTNNPSDRPARVTHASFLFPARQSAHSETVKARRRDKGLRVLCSNRTGREPRLRETGLFKMAATTPQLAVSPLAAQQAI